MRGRPRAEWNMATNSSTETSASEWLERRGRAVAMAIVGLAFTLRVVALVLQSDHLAQDRDAYLAIARNLAAGQGYVSVAGGPPTAYRPPLYPLVLALLLRVGRGTAGIAFLHTVLGVGTVCLTLLLGRRLGLGAGRFLAALLVAADPLLVQYSTFPMTETVFTFLVAALLAAGMSLTETSGPAARGMVWRGALVGLLFGLCALCRPTIWAFGVLAVAWWCLPRPGRSSRRRGPSAGLMGRTALVVAIAAGLTVAPWILRNYRAFGLPIVTTTHGGYTLLLGNNPVFYREVVAQPWGTVWSGESLARWQRSLRRELDAAEPPLRTEPERDRWMYRRAWRTIVREPGWFLRSCWLRFRRLWSVAPVGPVRDTLPMPAIWAIRSYYAFVTAGLILGLFRLRRIEWRRWMPLVLLIVAFTAVHLLYWSNMRMRAPLVPAIALLCALGLVGAQRHKAADGFLEERTADRP
ncbi:MAG TPA: dolichyl-phosphate-mannose-protein mannosyltransferase [Planctomycetaceae bacterium]|nr:dolichyl-phosphate-mannose-protein mannosyltransferase [Planctomycetaceae bacterium]